jgi:hypothetical protein
MLRAMVERGDVQGAVAFGIGWQQGAANYHFGQYDTALLLLTVRRAVRWSRPAAACVAEILHGLRRCGGGGCAAPRRAVLHGDPGASRPRPVRRSSPYGHDLGFRRPAASRRPPIWTGRSSVISTRGWSSRFNPELDPLTSEFP